MIQHRNLEEQLLLQLSAKLSKQGFKHRNQEFYKDTPTGKQFFHLSFIKHKNDFDITADVAVRHDALENLINDFNLSLSTREKSRTASVGTELGNLSIGRPMRWTISCKDDIPEVCSNIMIAFESIGLPYLQRFSSLEEILSALSGDDRESWLHSPINHLRAMKAIGAAFLLGKIEMFEQLVKSKTSYLQNQKDYGLSEFIEFAERLSRSWIKTNERTKD